MRISDWSSDVCSSDLIRPPSQQMRHSRDQIVESLIVIKAADKADDVRAIESKLRSQTGVGRDGSAEHVHVHTIWGYDDLVLRHAPGEQILLQTSANDRNRSEEHTSELQSLMRLSYAVFCLNKQKLQHQIS